MGGSTLTGAELLKYLANRPFRDFEQEKVKISSQALEKYKDIRENFHNAKIGSVTNWEKDILLIEPVDSPFRFMDKIFVLIGPRTFSGCVVFASIIKFYHIGLLIGEETGDTLIRGGQAYTGRLPHSGLEFYVPVKYFVLPGGKPDGRGVIPDFEVKQKPEDTAKGIDTALQFTLNLIKDPNFTMETKD
jgi:C-terminal processing protease CtpA/Prc